MLFWPILSHFLCPVQPLVTFSSPLSSYKKNPKSPQKFKKIKKFKKKNPKKPKKIQNINEN